MTSIQEAMHTPFLFNNMANTTYARKIKHSKTQAPNFVVTSVSIKVNFDLDEIRELRFCFIITEITVIYNGVGVTKQEFPRWLSDRRLGGRRSTDGTSGWCPQEVAPGWGQLLRRLCQPLSHPHPPLGMLQCSVK